MSDNIPNPNLTNLENNVINNEIKEEVKLPKLIWIDYNLDKKENLKYKNELKDLVFLIECKGLEEGLAAIKKIKFERIIVMLSKTYFNEFIPLFEKEKNNICCSLNIIIFTKKSNKSDIEDLCDKNKEISLGYLFNKINIFVNINSIKKFLIQEKEGKKAFSPHFENIDENNKFYYDEKMDSFLEIKNFEELILPLYFHKLIEPITLEEIHNFNYYLSTSFKETKNLISQFENIAEMPMEIICKYWARIYTLEKDKFYAILNNGLRDKKFKLFLPFIKMMYEGVKKKVFTSVTNEKLYSGGLIFNSELQKLKDSLNENNNNNNQMPKLIHYFKAFKSFSKNKDRAEKFMKLSKKNKNENATLVMFIINENNIEEEFVSNAYIKEYSKFEKEEEVLFFPFSSFEIEKIEEQDDHVIIYLNYLGKYRAFIKEKKVNIFKDIPINQFGKDLTDMGLIKYKFIKFWEVEKQISLNGNANNIFLLTNNIILFSIDKILKVYNLENDEIIQELNIHQKEIKDLYKINENIFISSSKDKTIKFIQFKDNYTNYILLKSISMHSDEVNQTIKLKQLNNLYLSCSNDKTLKFLEFDLNHTENNVIEKKSISYLLPFLLVYELPNTNILSISLDGYLKFWEYKDLDCNNIGSLRGFNNPLHNCISLITDTIILIGTKKKLIFVDFLKKQKIKKFMLEYNAYSIYNFKGSIFLGLKCSGTSCLLYEYNYSIENDVINLECIGKGRDICSKINFITSLDEKKIISCNINNYIKIWKETENKPKLLTLGNNPDYNFQEDYESDNELNKYSTPNGENNEIKNDERENEIHEINNYKKNDINKIEELSDSFEDKNDERNFFQNEIKNKNENENKNKNKEIYFSNQMNINNFNNKNPNVFNYDNSFLDYYDINNDGKINIIFNLETGLKIRILCGKENTIEELIKLFFEKMNYRYIIGDESIKFIYNTKKLKYNDKTKLKNFFYYNIEHIMVYDKNYSLMNNLVILKTFKGEEIKMNLNCNDNIHSLLKNYFEKIGKPDEINKYEGLKDITFQDFLVKLSNSN